MRGTKQFRSGAWRLQVWDAEAKRYVTRTHHAPNTKAGAKSADAELADMVVKVEAGKLNARPDVTVAELLERWLTHASTVKGWSPKTAKENAKQVRLKILPAMGDVPLRKVRPVDLDAFYGRLLTTGGEKGGPLASSSVRRIHIILHAAFNQAVRWGLLDRNPAGAASPPQAKTGELQVPTPEQVRALIAASDAPFATYLRVAASTGHRRGTLAAWRWRHVDLDGGMARFERAFTIGEDGPVEKGTKADTKVVVALDPHTVAALRAHRAAMAEMLLAVGERLTEDDFVFLRPGTREPWHPDGINQRFYLACRHAKVTGVRLHDLKHFAVTQLLAAGQPPSVVADRTGTSVGTILRVYRHWIPGSDTGAAETMGRLLG